MRNISTCFKTDFALYYTDKRLRSSSRKEPPKSFVNVEMGADKESDEDYAMEDDVDSEPDVALSGSGELCAKKALRAAKKPSAATQKRGKAKGSSAKAAKATRSSAKVATAKALAAQPSAKPPARQRQVLWDKAKDKDLQEANMSKKRQKKPTEKQGAQLKAPRDSATAAPDGEENVPPTQPTGGDAAPPPKPEVKQKKAVVQQKKSGVQKKTAVMQKKKEVQKKKAVGTPMVLDVETSTNSGVEKRSRFGTAKASGDGSGKHGGAKKGEKKKASRQSVEPDVDTSAESDASPRLRVKSSAQSSSGGRKRSNPKTGNRKAARAAESSSGGESRFSPHEIVLANKSAVVSERAAPVVAVIGDDEDLPTPFKLLAVKKPRERHSATSDDRAKMEKAHAAVPHDAPPIPRNPYKSTADATSAVEQYVKAEGHFFRIRSTTSVEMFNGKHGTHLPDSVGFSFRNFRCIHGVYQATRSKGDRNTPVLYTGGLPRFDAQVMNVKTEDGPPRWRVVVMNAWRLHNHLPEDNTNVADIPEDGEVMDHVAELNPANAQDRLKNLLHSLKQVNGSEVLMIQDDLGITCGVVIQTDVQKVCFEHWGENLALDFTHGTNNLGFHLGSLIATGPTGRGIPILDFLALNERAVTMTSIFKFFKRKNPGIWEQVRSFVIDKHFVEWSVLEKCFPKAKVLLCQFHDLSYWKKLTSKRFNLKNSERDTVQRCFANMLYKYIISLAHTCMWQLDCLY
ncbi:hypothetical protein BBJ28_00019940 [Nothophytophthora sp. Chile5]|nr:hypothetical protein BBJ28_00019940 [Nothophytophthora sp. Chile5]